MTLNISQYHSPHGLMSVIRSLNGKLPRWLQLDSIASTCSSCAKIVLTQSLRYGIEKRRHPNVEWGQRLQSNICLQYKLCCMVSGCFKMCYLHQQKKDQYWLAWWYFTHLTIPVLKIQEPQNQKVTFQGVISTCFHNFSFVYKSFGMICCRDFRNPSCVFGLVWLMSVVGTRESEWLVFHS